MSHVDDVEEDVILSVRGGQGPGEWDSGTGWGVVDASALAESDGEPTVNGDRWVNIGIIALSGGVLAAVQWEGNPFD